MVPVHSAAQLNTVTDETLSWKSNLIPFSTSGRERSFAAHVAHCSPTGNGKGSPEKFKDNKRNVTHRDGSASCSFVCGLPFFCLGFRLSMLVVVPGVVVCGVCFKVAVGIMP